LSHPERLSRLQMRDIGNFGDANGTILEQKCVFTQARAKAVIPLRER